MSNILTGNRMKKPLNINIYGILLNYEKLGNCLTIVLSF